MASSLKQDVKELKSGVAGLQGEVAGLRNDIRTSVDVRTQINPTFYAPAPPPDSQLPELEGRFRSVITEVLREYGIQRLQGLATLPPVPDKVVLLFSARYYIDKELRRIAVERFPESVGIGRTPSIYQIVKVLANEGLLDQRLANVVKEVYSVASPAVHGEDVSDAQAGFVRDVAPELISALRAIGPTGD